MALTGVQRAWFRKEEAEAVIETRLRLSSLHWWTVEGAGADSPGAVSRTNKNSCLQRACALRRHGQQTVKRANDMTRKNVLSVKKKIKQRRV